MPGKKKGKGKKPKKQENRTDTMTEVDKTFYELQITDLNRKLARLKQTAQEYEDKNQQLEHKLVNLDEDRADVISYLQRTLSGKQSESLELQERVTALQETKESETKEFETIIEDLQTENKTMREQLTSEIKLLTGKLNALEEFRMARDDLMERFEEQERTIQEQEKREKKVIYDIEKKFIISKKNITSEMEKHICKLANDFENANEIRIAASTHRCIRENIALNNELNKITSTLDSLNHQVDEYKAHNKELKLNCELYQAERNKAINELQVVRGHLDQMTKDFHSRVKILRAYEAEMKKRKKENENMSHALQRELTLDAKVRILEQNLHATRCKEVDLKQLVSKQAKLLYYFQEVNREAVIAIEDCLKISLHPRLDEAGKQYRRELLLQNLLTILTQPKIDTHAVLSMESLNSIDSRYKRGDLGFLPKEVIPAKQRNYQMLNAAVQVTPRYEDTVNAYSPVPSRQPSFESESKKSNVYMDNSSFFQACSMLDFDKNYSAFSSIILPNKYISETDIARILSSSEMLEGSDSSSTPLSGDGNATPVVTFNEFDEPIPEQVIAAIEERIKEEADEKQEEVEEEEVEEEEVENTVFGNTDDEKNSNSSRDD